jgi:hypothetical protein
MSSKMRYELTYKQQFGGMRHIYSKEGNTYTEAKGTYGAETASAKPSGKYPKTEERRFGLWL